MAEDLVNLLREADLDLDTKNFDLAQEKLQHIMQLDPQNEAACYKLAQLFAVRGLINSVVNQYFVLMDILEAKGQMQQALESANQIIKLDPENINARMKSILIYKKQNKIQEVINQSLILARLLIELGQGDQSIVLLQQAQDMSPENLDIGLELAEIYTSYGHIQEAIPQYRKVASAFLEKGLLSKAVETYRRLKVISPEDINVLLSLGKIYMELGRLKEAENEFRSVLRQDLDNIEALMLLGEVCQKKGQIKDAVLAFNKVISINSQEVKALEKLGELYQEQGKLPESIKNLLEAAQNYQLLGNIEKAIKLYQKVLLSDPTNPIACRQLTNLGAPLAAPETELEEPEIIPAEEEPLREEFLTTFLKSEEKPEEKIIPKEEIVLKVTEEKEAQPVVLIDIAKEAEEIFKKQEKIKSRKLVKEKIEKKLSKTGLVKIFNKDKSAEKPVRLIKVSPKEFLLAKKRGLVKSKAQDNTLMRRGGLVKGKLISAEVFQLTDSLVSELKQIISEPKLIKKEDLEKPEVLAVRVDLIKEIETEIQITPEPSKIFEETVLSAEKESLETPPETKKTKTTRSEQLVQAGCLIQKGEISEGIHVYTSVLSQEPDNTAARAELANVYLDFGLLDYAEEQYQVLLKQQPDNIGNYEKLSQVLSWLGKTKELVQNYTEIGLILENKKDYKNLVEIYQKIILLDGKNLDICEKLAELYLALKQTNEAIFHLENLAEQLLKEADYSKAVNIFKKVFELTKDLSVKEKIAKIYEESSQIKSAVKEYMDLAYNYKELILIESAITCFEKATELDPENAESYENLIQLYKLTGDLDNYIGNIYVLGNIFIKTKDFEKARNLFEDILNTRPNHLETRNRLIDVYISLKQKEQAFQQANYLIDKYMKDKNYNETVILYQKLLNYDPENVSLREELSKVYILSQEKEKALEELLNLIKTLERKEDWGQVVKVYNKALKINSESFDLYYKLGLVYLEKLNDINSSTEKFEKAFQINPSDSKVIQLLINGYLAVSKPSQAIHMLNHLIGLEPSFGELRQAIISQYKEKIEKEPENIKLAYDLGVIYLELNKTDDAIEQFQSTRKQHAFKLRSYDMLGVCFARKSGVGMFDLSVRQFKKALELEGYPKEEYLQTKYDLALIYESRGMKTEALKYYKEIFEQDENFKDVAGKVKNSQ